MPTPKNGCFFIESIDAFHIAIRWLFDVSPKSMILLIRPPKRDASTLPTRNCGDENIAHAGKNNKKNKRK